MKKLWILLLIPLLFLTACGTKGKETRKLTCVLEDGEQSTTVVWEAKKITVTNVLVYDTEDGAQINAEAFKVSPNIQDVTLSGNKVTTVTVTENNITDNYDDAKASYENQGYTCK